MLFGVELLFTAIVCLSQNLNNEQKTSPYLLDNFEEAEVFFHDGSRYRETINYNLLTNYGNI